jgi:hypothetical protein
MSDRRGPPSHLQPPDGEAARCRAPSGRWRQDPRRRSSLPINQCPSPPETLGVRRHLPLSSLALALSAVPANPSFGQLFPLLLEVTRSLTVKLWRSASTPRTSRKKESRCEAFNHRIFIVPFLVKFARIREAALISGHNRRLWSSLQLQGERTHLWSFLVYPRILRRPWWLCGRSAPPQNIVAVVTPVTIWSKRRHQSASGVLPVRFNLATHLQES